MSATVVTKTDELFAIYNPVNAVERMLVTQIAQTRERLDRAYELEARYFSTRDVLEVLNAKLAEFKALTRFVTDSERAWRHAVTSLEKCQRQRMRESKPAPAPRRAQAVSQRPVDASQPTESRPAEQPLVQTAHSRRE